MNFELNEDQAALAESLSRLLADRYGFEKPCAHRLRRSA
jgi:pimeloyl-CoA dehydrogenase